MRCLFLFFLLTTIRKTLLGSKLNLKTRLTRYNKIEENMQTAKTYRVIGQIEWSKTACSHSAAATTLRISTKNRCTQPVLKSCSLALQTLTSSTVTLLSAHSYSRKAEC